MAAAAAARASAACQDPALCLRPTAGPGIFRLPRLLPTRQGRAHARVPLEALHVPPRRPPLAPHLQAQPAPFAPRTLSPPLPSRPLRRPPSGPLRFSHAWWPACTPFHHLSDLGGTKERTCSTVQGGADLRESVWGHAREGCVRARNSEFTSKGQQQHRPPAEFWLNASCSRLRVLGGGIPSGSLGWKRNHVQRSLRRSW